MNLLYKLDMNSLPNMWLANLFFSFRTWPFNFIDSFFYYAEDLSLMLFHYFIFPALAIAFDDLHVWAAYILESNPL